MPREYKTTTVQVPNPLYKELKARATRDGSTISGALRELVRDGRRYEELHQRLMSEGFRAALS